MNIEKNKQIGVWGFGICGKAAVRYLHSQGYHRINIMDKRMPTPQEQDNLRKKNIQWYMQGQEDENIFFSSSDYIIPSAGINIEQLRYATHMHKWIHELDFFHHHFHKPIIAVTGSIGKTSVVSILGEIFKGLSLPVAVGGNIGIPTFDLIEQQNNVHFALLELSSFQLLHCTQFAPHLAIWTNFHPNHLDYHETEAEYFNAKATMLRYQKDGAYSLVALSLREQLPLSELNSRAYFTAKRPDTQLLNTLSTNESVYYIENDMVVRYTHTAHVPILTLTPALKNFSFIDNIVLVTAVCDIMNLDNHIIDAVAKNIALPAHRVEHCGRIATIDFYNDSKATTTASTLAAVEKLHNHPLHLFLGGLSKGVDRTFFVGQLKNKVKHIYCFGQEAAQLYDMCKSNDIPAASFATLTEAVAACTNNLMPDDCVLLSPAGSSYDLYENYEHRGNHFKELVREYIKRYNV
jgi:UDP-N-acetylmuramoylalanine--D-glutamate ligase